MRVPKHHRIEPFRCVQFVQTPTYTEKDTSSTTIMISQSKQVVSPLSRRRRGKSLGRSLIKKLDCFSEKSSREIPIPARASRIHSISPNHHSGGTIVRVVERTDRNVGCLICSLGILLWALSRQHGRPASASVDLSYTLYLPLTPRFCLGNAPYNSVMDFSRR
jgi:hypothetical protein